MPSGAEVRKASVDDLTSDAWLIIATGDSGETEVGTLVKRGVPVHGHEAVWPSGATDG